MKLFLSHRIDIYGFSESIYFGVSQEGDEKLLSIDDILNYPDEIITYDVSNLLNQIRASYKGTLPIITDLGQMIKINAGRSKKTYPRGKYPWYFWNRLNRDIGEEKSKILYHIIREGTDQKEISSTLKLLAEKLKMYYEDSIERLQQSGQLDRFLNFENLVQQILHKRQLEGIHIDTDLLNNLIDELEVNKNALVNKLRFKHNLIDLNYRSIRLYLIKRGFEISSEDLSYFNLMSFLKTTKISSSLCKDIYNTLRVKSDFENLQQYIQEDGLIYPEFDCIGTITSRILIIHPHVQQLKKENRVIVQAKPGYSLLYCDFKQFEPGILASFSKDFIMIEMYNSNDIYSTFSEYLFGTNSLRKEAKVLFLSYLYGMSNKKLVKSIEAVIKTKDLSKKASATEFFSKFKELEMFKTTEFKKALELGYIDSEYTIRRNIKKTKKGKGLKSETRYVLGQLIQGTASFILKKSILDVSKNREIEFLVPMHDAVLYQVPEGKLGEMKRQIEICFIENFKQLCPEINVAVDFKLFTE